MLLRPQNIPDHPALDNERQLWKEGFTKVAGIDEVGRGPLAGPVLTAAVTLTPGDAERWEGILNDSKQMTESQRESAYEAMIEAGVAHGVGACTPEEIDTIGIAPATRLAMARAVEALDPMPDYLLIDAVKLEGLSIPQTSIIKGDAVSLSIAAASVVAKVTRDRLMAGVFEEQYPQYGFASHKGYGTAAHMAALREHGPCPIHRVSFRPVREAQGITN